MEDQGGLGVEEYENYIWSCFITYMRDILKKYFKIKYYQIKI